MNIVPQVLLDNRQKIMDMWQEAVLQQVDAAQPMNHISLRGQFPKMINDIAEIIDRFNDGFEDEKYLEIIDSSTNHGRHRATCENYTIDQVVHEYFLFQRELTTVLRSHDVYTSELGDLLKYIVETAILKSTIAFNTSLQQMHQKLVEKLAHDLRNPLSTIYGLLGLMMSFEPVDEKYGVPLKLALRSIKRSLQLTEGILDAVTVNAGAGMMLMFSKEDVVKEVEKVYEVARQIYAQEIILECSKKEIIGIIDGTAIRRMLENLLTNAIKYGDQSKPVTIKLVEEEDQIRLSVHNHGNSISPERKQSMLDFLNDKSMVSITDRKSWGVGLILVKIIAEAHGGSVSFSSNAEEGTWFTISLRKDNELGQKQTHMFNET